MLVCSEKEIAGVRVTREIGRITAASGWQGADRAGAAQRDQALKALIAVAKDFEADAIIGVDYTEDGAQALDLIERPVRRVAISGIAVKLARAA